MKNSLKLHKNLSQFQSLKNTRQSFINHDTILQSITNNLDHAYKTLPSNQFHQILQTTILKTIKRAEVQSLPHVFSPYITKWVNKYQANINLYVRSLLLEVLTYINDHSTFVQPTLNKIKFIVLDTNMEYLLTKVFLYQAKYYKQQSQHQKSQKALKKAIQYSQQYSVHFLKESDQVRKQIVDNIIVAYFQLFKLNKQEKLQVAVQYLSKAYNGAVKNYGHESIITQNLLHTLNHQTLKKKSLSNMRISAHTIIKQSNLKKNRKAIVSYLWQDQVLIAKLVQKKNEQEIVLSQSKLDIKLDKEKINILKNIQFIQINDSQIMIDQEELYNAIDLTKEPPQKYSSLKQINKQDVFKKSQFTSSEQGSDQQDQIKNQIVCNFDLTRNKEKNKSSKMDSF